MCDRLIQSGRHRGIICQHVNKVCPHASLRSREQDIGLKELGGHNNRRLETLLDQVMEIQRVYEQASVASVALSYATEGSVVFPLPLGVPAYAIITPNRQ